MVVVYASVERICSRLHNTQPSELLTSVQAFGFDIEEQQYQATSPKKIGKYKPKTS